MLSVEYVNLLKIYERLVFFFFFIMLTFVFLPFVQRDIIGIGGSWSEFVDYFVASLKSEDLKLVLEANSSSDGNCGSYTSTLPLKILN